MTIVNVSLDCRNSANSDPNNGYTNTTTSNGGTYCYKYSGGTDGHGGVTAATGSGTVSITVTAGQDPRYVIDSVQFSGDDVQDLSYEINPANPHQVLITDLDAHDANDYYKVIVRDTSAGVTFPCDPPIVNEPRR